MATLIFVKQIITPIDIKRKSRKLSHTHDEDTFERRRVECELINRQYSYYPPLKDNIAVWERLDCTTRRPPDILDEGTYVPF